MRNPITMAVGFLVVACGGTSTESLTASSQMASARGGNSEWVLTTVDVPPGDFVFPADCIGETFQYVGTLYFKDHYVTEPKVRFILNAPGEYRREFVSFTCSAKPR